VPKSTFRIDILGTSLSIAADEDISYLEGLMNRYRTAVENTRKNTGLSDPLKIAVVTGFLICDEVQKLQARLREDGGEAERLTAELINRIDAVLP
jgi:cell division protein ZapA (FtsZ GTPase activity inhibitor)